MTTAASLAIAIFALVLSLVILVLTIVRYLRRRQRHVVASATMVAIYDRGRRYCATGEALPWTDSFYRCEWVEVNTIKRTVVACECGRHIGGVAL